MRRRRHIPHSTTSLIIKTATCAMLWFLTTLTSAAQDIHFSMIDLDPLLFNPAYSGFFDGQGRFGLVYRNQWASVSTPFQTFAATAEWGVMRNSRNSNGISAGLWLSTDRAGSLDYGATSAAAILSYYQGIGRKDDNILSVGLEVGVGQIGFNVENIELAEGLEDFPHNRAFYPTIGLGVAWFRQYSDEFYTKIGLSLRNINQPNISYMGLDDTRLRRHFNLYGRGEWRIRPKMSLLPLVGYQRQYQFNEIIYGCDVRWYVRESYRDFLAFGAGLVARHGDALCLDLSVMWQSWAFAFAYDANISRLATASHTLGAFEVGITYMIPRKQQKYRALPCPII